MLVAGGYHVTKGSLRVANKGEFKEQLKKGCQFSNMKMNPMNVKQLREIYISLWSRRNRKNLLSSKQHVRQNQATEVNQAVEILSKQLEDKPENARLS